ncbi:MAG: class IIb bacteriocin, lactobin A/cerein 7B family [Mariniphaga sp.]
MKHLNEVELREVEGGFLPIAIFIGIGVFEVCCCIVALGMQARLDQQKEASVSTHPEWTD